MELADHIMFADEKRVGPNTTKANKVLLQIIVPGVGRL